MILVRYLRGVSVSQKYLSTMDIPVQKRGHCGILAFCGGFRISSQGGGPTGKAMAAAKTKGFSRDMRKLEKYYKWKVNGKQTNICLYIERESPYLYLYICHVSFVSSKINKRSP